MEQKKEITKANLRDEENTDTIITAIMSEYQLNSSENDSRTKLNAMEFTNTAKSKDTGRQELKRGAQNCPTVSSYWACHQIKVIN